MSAEDRKREDEKAGEGDRLDDRIAALRDKVEAGRRRDEQRWGSTPGGSGSGIGQALKLGSEFAAGVLVGAGIGYAIDRFFGTTPWGLIVFLLLGFAAGTLNVLRATGKVAEPDPHRYRRKDGGGDGKS